MAEETFTASAVSYTATTRGEAVFSKIQALTDNAEHRLNTLAGGTVDSVETSATVVISFFFTIPTTTANHFGFVLDLQDDVAEGRIGVIVDRTEMTANAMTGGGSARILGSRLENIATGVYRAWSSFVVAKGMSAGGNHAFQSMSRILLAQL